MSDTKTELAEVRKAISTIHAGGQSYKIGSRSLTRADLQTLYARENELESKLAEEQGGGGIGRSAAAAFFDRR